MKASKLLRVVRQVTNESLPLDIGYIQALNQYGEAALLSSIKSIVTSVMMDNRLKSISNWSLITRKTSGFEITIKAECNLLPNKVIPVDITFVFDDKGSFYLRSSYEVPEEGKLGRTVLLLSGRKWQTTVIYLEDVEFFIKKWLRQCDRVLLNDMKQLSKNLSN